MPWARQAISTALFGRSQAARQELSLTTKCVELDEDALVWLTVVSEDGNTPLKAILPNNHAMKVHTMSEPSAMAESDFHLLIDRLLLGIQELLDDANEEIDSDLASGILTLTFDDSSKIIINRQTPNRELWVAAKSGGFHFKFVAPRWIDTRSGEQLQLLLSRVISEQAGSVVTLDFNDIQSIDTGVNTRR